MASTFLPLFMPKCILVLVLKVKYGHFIYHHIPYLMLNSNLFTEFSLVFTPQRYSNFSQLEQLKFTKWENLKGHFSMTLNSIWKPCFNFAFPSLKIPEFWVRVKLRVREICNGKFYIVISVYFYFWPSLTCKRIAYGRLSKLKTQESILANNLGKT